MWTCGGGNASLLPNILTSTHPCFHSRVHPRNSEVVPQAEPAPEVGLRLADEFEAWGGLQVHLEVIVQEDVNANRPTHAESGLRASVVGRPNVCAGTDKPLYGLVDILGGQGAFE